MKAVSPVRSIRKPALYFSEHNLGITRSKSSLDDPLSLLYNMNDCYSRSHWTRTRNSRSSDRALQKRPSDHSELISASSPSSPVTLKERSTQMTS
ncbi:hypothetical protein QQF64_015989 [Cirrhinus molitorella]|uniref:Uncharacterized protein n=1 Tax=Cirrhinus molitorella TaxID=172907 RepID=A0ABR3LLH1_9TELE